LQQRGERRRGVEATNQYSRSVAKFTEALQLGLSTDLQPDAFFGMAESQQEWAAQVLAIEGKLPDAQQSMAVAQEASQTARGLLEQAVQSLQQMHQLTGRVWDRADGPVNCGNVLSELAELQAQHEKAPTLQEAVQCYQAALLIEEDAIVCSRASCCPCLFRVHSEACRPGAVPHAALRNSLTSSAPLSR
jgi:hypothetical protein